MNNEYKNCLSILDKSKTFENLATLSHSNPDTESDSLATRVATVRKTLTTVYSGTSE